MVRTEKQVYTMDKYLKWMKAGIIGGECGIQRVAGQWDKRMVDELIITVLMGSYVPPMIVGEMPDLKIRLIDGLQRSVSLFMFRYGNYRIATNVEDFLLPHGCMSDENMVVDVGKKKYDELSEQLKKAFDEYQIEVVIYPECSPAEVAQLVRCYNNHVPLNKKQKAFTYAERFAEEIREIAESRFFVDCGVYTEREKMNGTLEKVVMESVMCIFHLKDWKKQPAQMAAYLNQYASKEEFELFRGYLCRLEKIVSEDISGLFTAQDSFLWFTLFHIFSALETGDNKFADFLNYSYKNMNGRELRNMCICSQDRENFKEERLVIGKCLMVLTEEMGRFLNTEIFFGI